MYPSLDLALLKNTINSTLSTIISKQKLTKLNKHYQLLIEWNKKINLTRITEPEEATIKHYIDSLLCLKFIDGFSPDKTTMLDVGTGGGFPGIPLSICLPNIKLYLLESSAKKCTFLQNVLQTLELNAEIINKRAEDYAKEARVTFDFIVSRALADPIASLKLCSPFLKIRGRYIQFAGPSAIQRIEELKKLSRKIGVRLENFESYTLPLGAGERLFIVYSKP